MTILVVSQVFPPRTGGSGRWLWELYQHLPGAVVHVAAGEVSNAGAFDAGAPFPIRRMGLDFPNWGLLHAGGGPHYAAALLKLLRLVSAVRADVLHCAKCLPEGLLAAAVRAIRGVPFVVYAHGEELLLAQTSRELRTLTQFVLARAQLVVANSRHTAGLLARDWAVATARVGVMHPGVDARRFTPAPASVEAKRRLGWEGRRVVLTVGALQKRKGQDMLIRSLPAIRAVCPDVLYAMIGQPLERAYLEALAGEHGVTDLVQFRGAPSDDDLIDCYQQCDLFALPSRQIGWDIEGFGIAALEAQSCGKPAIVGRAGGAPETVEPSLTGEVVDCDTPEQLAEAVIGLLEDAGRRERMGSQARAWVAERFDWRVLGDQASRLFAAAG